MRWTDDLFILRISLKTYFNDEIQQIEFSLFEIKHTGFQKLAYFPLRVLFSCKNQEIAYFAVAKKFDILYLSISDFRK